MTEVIFFHYRPKNRLWHRRDPRLKILELILLGGAALRMSPPALGILGLLLAGLHLGAGSSLKEMRRPLKAWFFLALMMTLALGLTGGGPPLTLPLGGEKLVPLPLSLAGMGQGALRALRLLVMLAAGQLFAATTSPGEFSWALRKLFFFLPGRLSGRLATMFALTLSFIPLLLDEAKTVREAAFSRGLGSCRSPLRRTASLALPLLEGLLCRGDLVAEALLSRGYVDDPALPESRLRWGDIFLFLGMGAGVLGGMILFP